MNFHEHSEFCMDKIEELQGEAYCSKNYYHWICPRCFNDFKQQLNFSVQNYNHLISSCNREGTEYHELQMGKFDGKFWKHNSLLIVEGDFMQNEVYSLLSKYVKNYDYFSDVKIDHKQWKLLKVKAKETGGNILELIEELSEWADYSIEKYKCFTIVGIQKCCIPSSYTNKNYTYLFYN